MREVVITGLGVVSAAGTDREAFFEALESGRSGVVDGWARVGDFGIKQYVEPRAVRRLARLSQMALVAAKQALAQAGALPYRNDRSGIVLGTGLGTIKETIEFLAGVHKEGPTAGSPLLFPSSVMNAAAGQMALELGWRGPNSTVNHREESALSALAMGADWLELGRADALLVGAVDELCEPAQHGWRRLGGLSPTGTMRPYGAARDGTVLGEGASVVLLERADDAARRGARVLARVAGFGANGETRPRVGWGGAWKGAVDAIRGALDEAGVDEVGYVCGGGCGLGVDVLEARAVAEAVGARPVGSILGQMGEYMASGALRVAAALFALERQRLPGTVGTTEIDPEAPIVDLVREPRAATVNSVLLPSLSQGGANTALVLRAD